jgi:CRP-like cAMP-binding protein
LIAALQKPISALKQSHLFDEGISTLVKNVVAREMVEIVLNKGETVTPVAAAGLYLVDDGEIRVAATKDLPAATCCAGEHFGEANLMAPESKSITFTAVEDTLVYFIPAAVINKIPLVHWRLLEMRDRLGG